MYDKKKEHESMDVTLFHLKPMQFLDVHMIFKMVSAVRDAI